MSDKQSNDLVKSPPEASLAEAYYADKEVWKSEPGNRYSPEELREMERNWDVQIKNPDLPHRCIAD